jgi:hypothetical protein
LRALTADEDLDWYLVPSETLLFTVDETADLVMEPKPVSKLESED